MGWLKNQSNTREKEYHSLRLKQSTAIIIYNYYSTQKKKKKKKHRARSLLWQSVEQTIKH
jgi:hypothetical protein